MNGAKLAYLLKVFPRLSETFVLNEILGQEAFGTRIHVYSRRRPYDEPRHAELARLKAQVEILPPSKEIDPWSVLFGSASVGSDLFERVRSALETLRSVEHPRLPSLMVEALWLLPRMRERGISHVHAHFASDSAITAMLVQAIGGPSFSFTCHAKDIYRGTVDPRQIAALLERCSFAVTVCDANVEHLRRMVGSERASKLRRLYNGVDLASWTRVPAQREPGLILSVGRLVEKKGFEVLIDALSILKRRGTSFRAAIIGDGDQRAALAERARNLGLEHELTFTGALDQDAVRQWMARGSVFALPCRIGADGNRDALPTALLEALAAGIPCVSTPVTGIPEILDHGAAGVLVGQDDPQATASALEALLADPSRRTALARRGRQRAEQLFDAGKNAKELHAWFAGVHEREPQRCASPA